MRPLRPLLMCSALLALGLAGCGDVGSRDEVAPPAKVQWRESKPNSHVGRIRAAVIERPAPDRALIEAHWENRSGSDNCAVELVVPEGVVLLSGERRMELPGEDASGSATWMVEFPSGRALDAVLRFCAQTDDGLRAAETTIRLINAP